MIFVLCSASVERSRASGSLETPEKGGLRKA